MSSSLTVIEDGVAAPRSLDAATTRIQQFVERPVRAAFLARGMNALARLADTLDEGALSDATGAPSDFAVLLYALENPQVLEVLKSDDPLSGARLRGLKARAQMLEAEGGTLSADQVAQLLRLSRQAVDKRRRGGKLLAVRAGRRGYAYPAWQFDERGVLPGLVQVLADLSDHDNWMQLAFFLAENARLAGKTPLALLRKGELDSVRLAARTYGEHGAS